MNELMNILPTILEEQRVVGLDKEIATCEAIGQTARATRLRLHVYARLCSASGFKFIVRIKSGRDRGKRSYVVDSPDTTNFDEIPYRETELCPLTDWLSAMPTAVVDNVLAIKDKINMPSLHIEHDSSDPALLYFLGEVSGRWYYVKLAQW